MTTKTHHFISKPNACSICDAPQVTRRYKNEAYCLNCYFKWFIRKTCERCQQTKRIYLSGTTCLACEKKTDCIRCSKKAGTFSIGKITPNGVVCSPCSVYFREKKACHECGVLSQRLSRTKLAKHNQQICPTCYRKYGYAICSNCKRHRKTHNTEQQLCKKCDEQLISHCLKCKQEMPSGYGVICDTCSKRKLLFNLIRHNSELFQHKSVKTAYKKFIFWYIQKCDVSVALLKSDTHTPFFLACDSNWQSIPNYETLVQYFKPNGLRGHLTVLRWLTDTELITINENLKDEISELERIQALFDKLTDSIPYITSYYEQLQRKYKNGKTSLKSVRLALQPAIDLVSSKGTTGYPKQEQLNEYLAEKTGQIPAITGFINHLMLKYHCDLQINLKQIQKLKEKLLKKQCNQCLVELYNKPNLTENEQMELVRAILYLLHNLFVKYPKKENIIKLNGTAYYEEDRKNHFLPDDIFTLLI